jgi:hypothetical protein
MVIWKVVAHLCLTLIIKELKFSVEHDRVVTTLNRKCNNVLLKCLQNSISYSDIIEHNKFA